jgi:ComF family protein
MNLIFDIGAAIFSAARELGGFVLPPVCPVCRAAAPLTGGLCSGCLDAAGLSPGWHEFSSCTLDAAGAAAPYAGAVEEMIKGLKYSGRLALAGPLGNLLALAAEGQAHPCDLLAPVPLHPRRLAERGFNQALVIARHLLRHAPRSGARLLPDLLRRVRYTRPQVELSGAERAANVKGAFAVAGNASLEGASVLLVDDVFTTGATLAECAAALKRAGAERVMALTVARTGG